MINSMTGFGKASLEADGIAINLEIKSLNNRYFDFHMRMPRELNYLENEIKRIIKSEIGRGRVELYFKLEYLAGNSAQLSVDYELLDQYCVALQQIKDKYQLKAEVRPIDLLRLSDVVTFEENELSEELLQTVSYLAQVEVVVEKIQAMAPTLASEYHQSLKDKLNSMLEDFADEQRILTEAAIMADKSDISEELVRLQVHCQEFAFYLKSSEPIGRKLDFLIQEMNREVNTIGSKVGNIEISKDVITIKSTLEKMREQVQNVE